MHSARAKLLAAAGLMAAWLAGCEEAEIVRYEVPREERDNGNAGPSRQMPPSADGSAETSASRAVPRSSGQDVPLSYDVPEGWEEAPLRPFSVATFEAGEDGDAIVTVSPLGGAAGGLRSNVDRWCRQIGLRRLSDEELEERTETVEVAGIESTYVDLVGPEERILAVIVPQGGQTWFFKMQGPSATVEEQKPTFDEFVQSVEFTSSSPERSPPAGARAE